MDIMTDHDMSGFFIMEIMNPHQNESTCFNSLMVGFDMTAIERAHYWNYKTASQRSTFTHLQYETVCSV